MNLLFVNTKGNWGGIVNLSVILMRVLSPRGVSSWHVFSKKKTGIFSLPSPVQNVPISFGFDYNPLTVLKLVILIKQHKINLVVVNIAKEIIFGGIAARICGIKCIRLIGNELDFESHRLLCSKLVDLNIFPSRYSLDAALQKFPYTKSLRNTVVYCGIEDRQVSPADKEAELLRLELGEQDFIIGCTGRVVRDKGVHILIQAFAKVCDALPNAVLVINGQGSYMQVLRDLVANLGLGNRIKLLGFAPDCLIAASIYDIAVMPSFFEGFPNTLIEYMSLGKPIISTAVGGIPEALTDGVDALLIKVDDANDLADKLLVMAGDEQLRNRLGDAAKDRFETNYTASAMADAFMESIKAIS
jgi:glycosyltransferase involved in cell wall biosynthesis